jgi:hypothetical protein
MVIPSGSSKYIRLYSKKRWWINIPKSSISEYITDNTVYFQLNNIFWLDCVKAKYNNLRIYITENPIRFSNLLDSYDIKYNNTTRYSYVHPNPYKKKILYTIQNISSIKILFSIKSLTFTSNIGLNIIKP